MWFQKLFIDDVKGLLGPEIGGEVSSGTPIEVATEAEIETILTNATVDDNGKIYKYTGVTTDTYEQNELYILEV